MTSRISHLGHLGHLGHPVMTMTAPGTPRRSPKVTAPHRGGPVRCGHGHANAAFCYELGPGPHGKGSPTRQCQVL